MRPADFILKAQDKVLGRPVSQASTNGGPPPRVISLPATDLKVWPRVDDLIEEYIPEPCKDDSDDGFGQEYQTRRSRSKNKAPQWKRTAKSRRRKELAEETKRQMKMAATPIKAVCIVTMGNLQGLYVRGELVLVTPIVTAADVVGALDIGLLELKTRREWYHAKSDNAFPKFLGDVRPAVTKPKANHGSRKPRPRSGRHR